MGTLVCGVPIVHKALDKHHVNLPNSAVQPNYRPSRGGHLAQDVAGSE
jgi:hypothetical protein